MKDTTERLLEEYLDLKDKFKELEERRAELESTITAKTVEASNLRYRAEHLREELEREYGRNSFRAPSFSPLVGVRAGENYADVRVDFSPMAYRAYTPRSYYAAKYLSEDVGREMAELLEKDIFEQLKKQLHL